MKLNSLLRVTALCLSSFALASVAQAASINGQVGFLGGALGTWSVQFNSGDPSVTLDQLVITLPATYKFDTQAGGFGYLVSQDFVKLSGGANATGLTPNTTASRDGAGALTIVFSGFNTASGAFTFDIDVDGTTTLQPTNDCSGKSGLALVQCVASNVPINAANLVASTAASIVDGTEIAGTTIAATFGRPGLNPLTLNAALASTGALTAQGSFSGTMVPEPGTYGLMGSGLLGLLWAARRRRRS